MLLVSQKTFKVKMFNLYCPVQIFLKDCFRNFMNRFCLLVHFNKRLSYHKIWYLAILLKHRLLRWVSLASQVFSTR